jgi:hypothetical protein
MEGSWAEPGQRDLGFKKSWPQINLSELPLAIPAPKGHASSAKTKPTNSVTVGRHPRHLSSMTSMAGFTPTALSALKGRALYVLQPMAATRRTKDLPV